MAISDHLRWIRMVWEAPGNRGRRWRALANAGRWFLHRRLSPGRERIIPVYGGLKFACHPASYMAKHVHYFSEFADYDSMHFIAAFLREGDAFLDVGANAGLYLLLAASRVKEGPIHCVEPQPENLKILRQNVTLNHLTQVHIHPIAAGDEESELLLAGHDVFAGPVYEADSAQNAHRVPVRRLDALLPRELFALAKIDVEGYEWPALRGLEEAIREGRLPVVLFELNGCLRRYGWTEDDFCAWLRTQGYTLTCYHHDASQLERPAHPRGDVIAIHETGWKMLGERLPGLKLAP